MSPVGLPLFGAGPPGGPLRTEHEPTTLAHEPTALDGQRDAMTAYPLFAKLVVAGDAKLLVKDPWQQNNMKLHHKRHYFISPAHKVWVGGHGSMAR
jgi:hypothetical protein